MANPFTGAMTGLAAPLGQVAGGLAGGFRGGGGSGIGTGRQVAQMLGSPTNSTLGDLVNGTGLGGGDVETQYATKLDPTLTPGSPGYPADIPGIGDQHGGQFWPGYTGPEMWDSGTGMGFPNPNYVPPPPGWYGPNGSAKDLLAGGQQQASPWQHPQAAFAPGASQNAPRLFQDPTTGGWTLSEHGNFRSLSPDEATSAQGYVGDFWNQNPTGFIQPGAANYDPTQAMSNEQYGQPSNWQSLWQNAGQQVPGMPMDAGAGGQNPMLPNTPYDSGTLADLVSQSSYGPNPLLVQ